MIRTEYNGITKTTVEAVVISENETHPQEKHYTKQKTFNLLCNCNDKPETPKQVKPVLHRKMTKREIEALQFPVNHQARFIH